MSEKHPNPDQQPQEPASYMGYKAPDIASLFKGIMSVPGEGETVAPANRDPIMEGVANILGAVADKNAANLVSDDPNRQARAKRFIQALLDVYGSNPGEPTQERSLDEEFARTPLSGDEAWASLAEVSQGLKSTWGKNLRLRYSIPERSDEEAAVTAKPKGPRHAKKAETFTAEEEPVAAIAIAVGLSIARTAQEEEKFLRPSGIFDRRNEVEKAVRESSGLVRGVSEARKAELIDSVYTKLPGLMGEAWRAQERAAQILERQLERHSKA